MKIGTYEWLMAKGRDGCRRIEKMSWARLARLYEANRPNSPVRKAINAECRRLGYTPRVVLALNAGKNRKQRLAELTREVEDATAELRRLPVRETPKTRERRRVLQVRIADLGREMRRLHGMPF